MKKAKMFKQSTVLDVVELPDNIRHWVDEGYKDSITSNGCYFAVYPYEVLRWDDETEERTNEVLTFEEFSEGLYDCVNTYNFLKWCVEQGQTEEFTLLYWW